MKKKLVSVILPVFRAVPDYLEQSLQSILSQTYDEIELIVVLDKYDHNIDGLSFAVLEKFKDDHRLQLVVNERRTGLASSLNAGIRFAKGEYIARMDSDDISLPVRIEEEFEVVRKRHFDLVGCWAKVIDELNRSMGYLSPPCEWQAIRKYLLFHNPFLHSTILFRRKVIEVVGLYEPEYELSEDYEFYMRAFSAGFKGMNIPKYLHLLREHYSSMVRGSRWKQNRITNLKCKLAGVFDYHFNTPRDVLYLGITPLSFLLNPGKVLIAKRLVGLYYKKVSPSST
ncbi:MAG TPA: glycosyltransferase [Acidobacteriota bacterium]|nr:glycosyltransferase [Acidobacteriota bacterium]